MKNKLLILSLFFCLNSFGQSVPNTETFSLQNVVNEMPFVGAVARVDLVTKSGYPYNCTVGCNGYSEIMVWYANAETTVTEFVSVYFTNFGAVTLTDNSNGSFTFTANVAGVDFAAATIDGTGSTAVNITANNPGAQSNNLIGCFTDAVSGYFDSRYYPYYLVTGGQFNVTNSQLNFRNYKGTPDGIPIPVATAATNILPTSFQANWNASTGATGYYIDVSTVSDFSSFVGGYNNEYIGDWTEWSISGLYSGTTYYYRIRAGTPNGTSGNSNTISLTTTYWVSPTYHDWYLPSISELGDIHSNTPWQNYGFQPAVYWSSTSYASDNNYAWGILFGYAEGHYIKASNRKVRAIRTFDSTDLYNIGDTGPAGGYIVKRTPIIPLGTYTYKEIPPSDQSQGAYWSAAITICDDL